MLWTQQWKISSTYTRAKYFSLCIFFSRCSRSARGMRAGPGKVKFDLVLWANSGDQIQDRTLHRTKREKESQ